MVTVVLRCTAKLTKLMGLSGAELGEPDSADGASEWYANLIWLDRRKCILFTHAPTLFAFLVPDVRKAKIVPIGGLLVDRAAFELVTEELPTGALGKLDPASVHVARTASRSVLGSMNEFAFQCETHVYIDGGLDVADIGRLNHRLRRIPMSVIGYRCPIDLAREYASRREM